VLVVSAGSSTRKTTPASHHGFRRHQRIDYEQVTPALKSLPEERSAQEQEEGDEVKTITPSRAKSRFLARHPPDWEHYGH
jgi:hypothetical protein